MARDCWTPEYFVDLYKEVQELKAKQHVAHALDAPTLNATENYIVSSDLKVSSGTAVKGTSLKESMYTVSTQPEEALLDSRTTQSILRNPLLFSSSPREVWQVCMLQTIVGDNNSSSVRTGLLLYCP